MTICKDCLVDKFLFYSMKYHDDKKALQRICMAFDLYYSDEIYHSCLDKSDVFSLNKYIQKISTVNHKGKTFETTVEEGYYFSADQDGISTGMHEDNGEVYIDPKMVKRWGSGLTATDYDVIQTHYDMLTSSNPNRDSNQDIFIDDLCYTKMFQMKAMREGNTETFQKLTESYRKTFKDAGLHVVRDITSDEDFKIGVGIRDIEQYTPAEYYKDKKLFADYDSIGDYLTRFVLRPLRNLQHGTSDRDHEFYVKEEDEGGLNG